MLKINWNPDTQALRQFGWSLLIGFGIIGTIAYLLKRPALAQGCWAIGGGVGLWAILFPFWAKPFYWVWMGIGFVMGSIVSRIVLGLIYFAVFTPVALFFRLRRRDELELKKPQGTSFWHEHPKITSKESYEHMF